MSPQHSGDDPFGILGNDTICIAWDVPSDIPLESGCLLSASRSAECLVITIFGRLRLYWDIKHYLLTQSPHSAIQPFIHS